MGFLWHFLNFIQTGTQNKAFDKWKMAAGFLWSLPCKFYHVRVSCSHFSMDFGCSQGWRWRFLRSRRVASKLGMWIDLSEKLWFQSNILTGIFRSKGGKLEKEWLIGLFERQCSYEFLSWTLFQKFTSFVWGTSFFNISKLVSREQNSWYPTMSWGGAWW